jgi:hypothetical protein
LWPIAHQKQEREEKVIETLKRWRLAETKIFLALFNRIAVWRHQLETKCSTHERIGDISYSNHNSSIPPFFPLAPYTSCFTSLKELVTHVTLACVLQ